MSDKKFLDSHRMKAGLIANVETFSMVIILLFASTKTEIVSADVMEYAMLAFISSIGVFGVGVYTNGAQRIREASAPPKTSTEK